MNKEEQIYYFYDDNMDIIHFSDDFYTEAIDFAVARTADMKDIWDNPSSASIMDWTVHMMVMRILESGVGYRDYINVIMERIQTEETADIPYFDRYQQIEFVVKDWALGRIIEAHPEVIAALDRRMEYLQDFKM